jgi:hypothetical protein
LKLARLLLEYYGEILTLVAINRCVAEVER